MFKSFYNLTETPFSRDIPTHELYKSEVLEETPAGLSTLQSANGLLLLPGTAGQAKRPQSATMPKR